MRSGGALILVVLSGCSSTFIDATVTKRSHPVAGVPVSMTCPQAIKAGGPSLLGRTDASGRLELRAIVKVDLANEPPT